MLGRRIYGIQKTHTNLHFLYCLLFLHLYFFYFLLIITGVIFLKLNGFFTRHVHRKRQCFSSALELETIGSSDCMQDTKCSLKKTKQTEKTENATSSLFSFSVLLLSLAISSSWFWDFNSRITSALSFSFVLYSSSFARNVFSISLYLAS